MLIKQPVIFITVLGLVILFFLTACSGQDQNLTAQRITSLNKSLLCPVCPGESIDQSQNDLAILQG